VKLSQGSDAVKTQSQLFAERGDEWNVPNPQHDAGPTLRIVEHRALDGTVRIEVETTYDVEGYDRPWTPYVRPKCDEPVKLSQRSTRRKVHQVFYPQHRPAEYRCIVPVAPTLPVDAKMPTEEDLARGRRQRAAVKARLTRAANKLAAKEAARKDAINEMAVKLSQWSF